MPNSIFVLLLSQVFQKKIKLKVNLNFYFQTFLWHLKIFYESFYCPHKTFWGHAKRVKTDEYVTVSW